jgi:hypothetical protein
MFPWVDKMQPTLRMKMYTYVGMLVCLKDHIDYTSGYDIVKQLVEPVSKTELLWVNWFTSMPLAEPLLKEKLLKYVGTLRKNKGGIPKEFLSNKQRREMLSMLLFQKEYLSHYF